MNEWDVYIDNEWIDSVFFTNDCDANYVKNSLIEHDYFPENIIVKEST
jgi:hypothetical protein